MGRHSSLLLLITLLALTSSDALKTSTFLPDQKTSNVQHQLSSDQLKKHSLATTSTSAVSHKVGLVLKANEYRSYEIIRRIQRNQLYFVEGLAFVAKSTLIESTGRNGRSEVHYLDIDSMKVSKTFKFDQSIFGEGCALVGKEGEKKVLVMTYQNNLVFELDENLQNIKRTLPLPSEMQEGWGMAKLNDQTILATDGSNKLFHIDPETFTVIKTVEVFYEDGSEAYALNELEVINGEVFANVFMQNNLLIIDPESGHILEKLDLQGLVDYLESEPKYYSYTTVDTNNCLNGIAYNHETDQLFVTGKNWPYIYQIQLNSVQKV